MSVAREDAAEPYITDFWPGNTDYIAVTSATHHGWTLRASLAMRAIQRRRQAIQQTHSE